MWDLKHFNIYTLCSQEKIIFSMWNLKPFSIYTLCSQEKKIMFFQCGIKKNFGLNTST
jgi:hypothetical protein